MIRDWSFEFFIWLCMPAAGAYLYALYRKAAAARQPVETLSDRIHELTKEPLTSSALTELQYFIRHYGTLRLDGDEERACIEQPFIRLYAPGAHVMLAMPDAPLMVVEAETDMGVYCVWADNAGVIHRDRFGRSVLQPRVKGEV
jgi:hypothetical protein